MNDSTTYHLTLLPGLLRHYPGDVRTVRDHAPYEIPRLDAAVRSQDYFITLATALEAIGLELARENPSTAQALDTLVADLEYLQRHYAIVRKSQAHTPEN